MDGAGIAHGTARSFATPRRLAVLVGSCAERAAGPAGRAPRSACEQSFDAAGAPTQAAAAFARNCGVSVADLERLVTEKGAWLVFRGTEHGAATAGLLGDIINACDRGAADRQTHAMGRAHRRVRPAGAQRRAAPWKRKWCPSKSWGCRSGNITFGHRFHSPRPISLKSPKSYESRLRSAKVVADFSARREAIREGVAAAAIEAGGTALIESALLDEVTALVEWPVPIVGRFEARFLSLPREVVIATVQDHQRYFAIEGPDGKLTGGFVTVSNIQSRDPAQVRAGNERVVRPRLSDAAFFWQQDRKVSLEVHASHLSEVTFQAKLGSYAEKTQRLKRLALWIGERIAAGADVGRAAELCKADLMTAMVGEFPELQGIMGRYYAEAEGLPGELALSLEEHYRPRYAGDRLPATRTGQALALADKIDTLTGIFAIEQRPTGAKDPFGLRRAALGVLRILLECRLDLDLTAMLEESAAAQPVRRAAVAEEVYDFIAERLRGLLLERADGSSSEMIDAVLASRPRSPLDADDRLQALKEFLQLPDAGVLTAINKRIANILRKSQPQQDASVRTSLFTEDAEHRLHGVLVQLGESVGRALAARRYAQGLRELIALRGAVDDFFERTMVMDENPELRDNRLALLRDAQRLLGGVADLSRLPG